MKKILLGTTAIIALSTFSAEAFAAEKIKLGLGGFMRHYVGLSNHDEVAAATDGTATRGVDLQQSSNSEIYFRGATTLDNGLSVSADFQMEASSRNGQGDTARKYDVASLEVSSNAMGAITIGSTTHSADDFTVRAPNAGPLDWGDFADYGLSATTTASSAGIATTAVSQMDGLGGKGMKLKYASPSFSGVNVHASYAADVNNDDQIRSAQNNATDSYSYGIAYSGEVSGLAVSADLTHGSFDTAFDQNHVGLSVGMAGFTVAGGYTDFNDTANSAAGISTQDGDGTGYEVGVSYETGAITGSASYTKVKSKGTVATVGDNQDTQWSVAGSYDLGAGVGLTAQYWKASFDAEGTTASVDTSGVIAGIEVGF